MSVDRKIMLRMIYTIMALSMPNLLLAQDSFDTRSPFSLGAHERPSAHISITWTDPTLEVTLFKRSPDPASNFQPLFLLMAALKDLGSDKTIAPVSLSINGNVTKLGNAVVYGGDAILVSPISYPLLRSMVDSQNLVLSFGDRFFRFDSEKRALIGSLLAK